jgi:hypothetical protein
MATKEEKKKEFESIRTELIKLINFIDRIKKEKKDSDEKNILLKDAYTMKTNLEQKLKNLNTEISEIRAEEEKDLRKRFKIISPGKIFNDETNIDGFLKVNELQRVLKNTDLSTIKNKKISNNETTTFVVINKEYYNFLNKKLDIIIEQINKFTNLIAEINPGKGKKQIFYNDMTIYYFDLYHDIYDFLESFKTNKKLDENIHQEYYESKKNIINQKIEDVLNYFNKNEPNIIDRHRQEMLNITRTINSSLMEIETILNGDYLINEKIGITGGKIRPIRSKKTRRNSTKKSKTARRRRNKKNVTNFR